MENPTPSVSHHPKKGKNIQTRLGESFGKLQSSDVSIAMAVSPQTDRWLDYKNIFFKH